MPAEIEREIAGHSVDLGRPFSQYGAASRVILPIPATDSILPQFLAITKFDRYLNGL
jgi:hypothetical protein